MNKSQDLPEEPTPSSEPLQNDISIVVEESQEPAKKNLGGPRKKGGTNTRELSQAFQEAQQALEQLPTPEEKINKALEFMRFSLAQAGNPRLKDFWDMRHYCLGLFKENLAAASRAHLWSAYVELSSEARRLKEILDEQAAFASEQIELAIAALEKDLAEYDELVAQMKPSSSVAASMTIKSKQSLYEQLQGELNLLNTLAARINALRKEIIKTDMRMKTKAKFFDKLSTAGDRIFPRRKELVKQISLEFVADIRLFVEKEFSDTNKTAQPLYVLRDEIKVLQGIAKILTLNTQAFKETRELLSACWDKIRESEKKKKEEFAQKRQVSQQNATLVTEKIALLVENAKKEDITLQTLQEEAQVIYDFMRTIDLDREAVHSLKNQIKQVLQPFLDQEKAIEDQRIEKLRQEEQKKKEKVLDAIKKVEDLVNKAATLELTQILEEKARLEEETAALFFGKAEKLRLDKLQKKLLDVIVDKKQEALLNLSTQDREALQQLKELLEERLHARIEIKKNLEVYRKALGGSGFDFEKAMLYREMMDSDKERLAKINESIADIEEKIAEIEM